MLAEFWLDHRQLETILIYSIPILGMVGLFSWLIVGTLSQTSLKRTMLERGMTPDEIERVLSAGSRRHRL